MAEMKLDCNWVGSNGKARVAVKIGGEVIDCDVVNMIQQKDRERFIKSLTKDRSGIDADDLREQLIKLAAAHTVNDDPEEQKSVTDLLIELVSDAELFHDSDRRGFATIKAGEHYETYPIRSKQFKLWLQQRLWEEHGKSPYSEALQTACNNIEAKAIFTGPEMPVHVRLAGHGGDVYLDLADCEWKSVQVTRDDWQVVDKSPVKFVRSRGMLPLPEPMRGGNIELLRDFLNIKSTDGPDKVLLVSWIIACLRPTGPFPILCISGEQGSAKSSACRIVRSLIDPNAAPLRATPKDIRDMAITANNSWLMIYDNLSRIYPWISDALCRLSTGGGFGTRELCSDREEVIFDAQRPVAINGIEDIVSRPDLLDRSIGITLSAISEDKRRSESELWEKFDKIKPKILGALLDAVSIGLRNFDSVKLDRLPRMADYARWITACEPGLNWEPGTFMKAYGLSRSTANAQAIEASIIGPVVIPFMESRAQWQGTYKELLTELEAIADDKTKHQQAWPKSARKLSGLLRRITPNLRSSGLEVKELGHGEKGSMVLLDYAGNIQSDSSDRQAEPANPDEPDEPDDVFRTESKTDLTSDELELWESQVESCLNKKDCYGEMTQDEAESMAWECVMAVRGGAA
jgi:hypothetical protein